MESPFSVDAIAAWRHAFVTFACDEINGTFDRLSTTVAAGAPCPAEIRARIATITTALSFSRPAFLPALREIAGAEPERPEDLFAPAAILLALLPDDPEVAAWAAKLPTAVHEALRALAAPAEAGRALPS